MKSIKEKALDVYPKMSKISEPHGIIPACNKSYYLGDANEEKREGFEAGANYVLDEIENVIKSDRILGHPFPSLEMRYNKIISVIEQLKK